MRLSRRTTAVVIGTAGLVIGVLTAGQGLASAAPAMGGGTFTCTGTLTAPGELSGTYSNVVINGACAVQTGPVHVRGNLTVARNGILNADYGSDGSRISIDGNLVVQQNGSVLMGCDTIFVTLWATLTPPPLSVPSFPCTDDPDQNAPTLSSHDTIGGSLIANQALGVVMNNDSVGGSIVEIGGGGGPSCAPSGVFGLDVGFPPYSTFADSTVGGSLIVDDLNTCFFGMFRVHIGGSLVNRDIVNSDPDGNEVATNIVRGSIICAGNSPADQFGDSNGQPNKVGGIALGQCGFGVTAPNPAPEAGVVGVTPVNQPISVPLY
jgi:hypothetical protein